MIQDMFREQNWKDLETKQIWELEEESVKNNYPGFQDQTFGWMLAPFIMIEKLEWKVER